MVQCLDGLKHFCVVVVNCCDADLYKQPRGLEDPEALARETVCMLTLIFILSTSRCEKSLCELIEDVSSFKRIWHLLDKPNSSPESNLCDWMEHSVSNQMINKIFSELLQTHQLEMIYQLLSCCLLTVLMIPVHRENKAYL